VLAPKTAPAISLAAGPFRRHGDRLLHHHRLAGDIDAHLAYFADDLAHLVGKAVVGLGQGAQLVMRDGRQVAGEIAFTTSDLVEDGRNQAYRTQDQMADIGNLRDVPGQGEHGQADHQGQAAVQTRRNALQALGLAPDLLNSSAISPFWWK
jgi:hypothetical protein